MKIKSSGKRLGWLFCVILMIAASSSAPALDIVKEGKPQAVIALACNAGIYQKRAALELKKYLKLISGAELEIVAEDKIPENTSVISIGHTKLAAEAGVNTDGFKNDWRRLQVKGNALYLIGRDQRPLQKVPALSPNAGAQGSFAAVVVFLRDVLGCRWFVPCPMGIYIPKTKDISVPDNLNIVSKPSFVFSHIYGRELACSYANNCRMTRRTKLFGCHTWAIMFDCRKYFDKHPEFYAMDIDGNRIKRGGSLCASNPELEKLFVKNIRKLFDDGYDMVQLGQSDGWRACNCKKCAEIDGHKNFITVTKDKPCEKILLMHNRIIRECAKSHPDKKIQLVIYSPSFWPSKQDASPYSNVIGLLCPVPERKNQYSGMDEVTEESVCEWGKRNIAEFSEYQYFFDNLINPLAIFPEVSPEWLKSKMKWNLAHGITGGGGQAIALSWPLLYAYTKMAENPEADPYEAIREYCRFIFGGAAKEMEEFYRKFYHNAGKVWTNRKMIFASKYPAEAAFTSSWTQEDIAALEKLLKEGEGKADSERSKGFMKKTRYLFDGFRRLAMMFFAKKEFDKAKTKDNLLKVKQCVDNFDKWRDKIFSLYVTDGKFIKNYWPNYQTLTVVLMSKGLSWGPQYAEIKRLLPDAAKGKLSFRGCGIGSYISHAEISEPLTWNFPEMLRLMDETGDCTEKYRVQFTNLQPVVDGKINWGAWAKAPPIQLKSFLERHKIDSSNMTSVKLLYDSSNLYILFECAENDVSAIKTYKGPRDGRVYGFDSVEVFLDPKCDPDKMFQFIASPADNAFFDAACDYAINAETPDRPPKNPKWDPEWTYLYSLEKSKKKWFIQIAVPFKSLGEKTPENGTAWLANFCRNRYARLESAEASSWIKYTFGSNPAIFGKLIFSR